MCVKKALPFNEESFTQKAMRVVGALLAGGEASVLVGGMQVVLRVLLVCFVGVVFGFFKFAVVS